MPQFVEETPQDTELSVVGILREEISSRPLAPEAYREAARAVGAQRLEPLLEFLGGVTNLVVIPSGRMLGIPVEGLLLTQGETFIGDRFVVSYAPSATIHAWLSETAAAAKLPRRDSSTMRRCLALGDPPFCQTHLAEMREETVPETARPASAPSHRPPSPMLALAGPMAPDLMRSAVVGNPDSLSALPRIPESRREVQAIAAAYGGQASVLLGPEASEQTLVEYARTGRLGAFDVIHIATHAIVDNDLPERSALVLSQVDLPSAVESAIANTRIYDGLVSAREIMREWKLDADLVVLSACETALGKKVAGEGYIGFAHAFFRAGARSLIVSLWRVADQSTAMLMERFHQDYLGGYAGVRGTDPSRPPGAPLTKAEALQEAKQWLRDWRDESGNRPYAHPAFWAGFILIGDRG